MEPNLDETIFKECDWKEYYLGATEAVLDNMPEPHGKPMLTTFFFMLIMLDAV
jgi:hypothetical protein